jgi:hypothetical protein
MADERVDMCLAIRALVSAFVFGKRMEVRHSKGLCQPFRTQGEVGDLRADGRRMVPAFDPL